MTSLTAPTDRFQTNIAIFLVLAMAATVGTALGFEHIGGYIPCKLCLGQRIPYYIGVPVMALAAVSAALRWPPLLTRGLLVIGGLIMVWSLFLGVRHSGVEWGWWAGPTDCGAVDGDRYRRQRCARRHRRLRSALLRQGCVAGSGPVLRRLECDCEPDPWRRCVSRRVRQEMIAGSYGSSSTSQ